MKLCDYGCDQEAKYQFKNGKWCCSKNHAGCLFIITKISKSNKGKNTGPRSEEIKRKISNSLKGRKTGPPSKETRKKQRISMKGKNTQSPSKETRKKQSISMKGKNTGPRPKEVGKKISEALKNKPFSEERKLTLKNNLEDYKEKYPFLFVVEELREIKNKEIQGRCKNHNCENSKEKGGWFTLTKTQLQERIRQLYNINGNGGAYFYCSQHCKDTCILHGLRSDPFKSNNLLPYTYVEYQTFRTFILERDNHICQFCGEPATDVHHERPQKLEPFSALDPDFAWSCCEKCHYEKGHKDECSTGNLAKIVCSVESQKFLNQTLEDI